MTLFRTVLLCILFGFSALVNSGKVYAGFGTSVPISADLASSIAGNLFPVTVKVSAGNLFLTEPVVLFVDPKRIGIRARFQAYDHRPTEGVAISEMGRAVISGELEFDSSAQQILLHNPRIDKLKFDRDSATTRRLLKEIEAQWLLQVTNPIRSQIPPHPYIIPFRENIQDLSYDGKSINLDIYYE